MCINKEISLVAWVVATALSVYLWQRNKNYDRWNASFIVTFSTIQLLEAGLWYSLENNYNTSMLTKIVLIALWMQPFIQSYAGYRQTNQTALLCLSVIFGLILLWTITRILSGN